MSYNLIMKKFSFKNSVATLALLIVVCLCSAGGLVWNIFNIVSAMRAQMPFVSYCISAMLNVLLAVLAVWFMFGEYVVTDKTIKLRGVGPFSFCTQTGDVVKFVLNETENKLYMFTANGKITTIVISPDKYTDFFDAVSAANPAVYLECVISDKTDKPDGGKKKGKKRDADEDDDSRFNDD